MTPAATDARGLALDALCDRHGRVTVRLNRLLTGRRVRPAEAALARELALGVVRRRAMLDAIITAFQKRRDARLPGRVRSILRLGVYQLVVLERVPEFAAVNEAVSLVPARHGAMRGFVNALLRGVGRSVSPPQAGRPPAAADVAPVTEGSFRRFDRAVFPDPGADPTGHLAAAGSLPRELARRWIETFAGPEGAMRVAAHANARPPVVLRVNRLRATVVDVLGRLGAAGVDAAAHANGLSVVLGGGANPAGLEVFAEGLVQPQDPSATAVVEDLDVRPGMRICDLCAAPGTKTTHLAERMDNRGEIVASDVSDAKLARVQDNCRRMGAGIVRTVAPEQAARTIDEPFDLVLADVPCSNTGVLARRVEARWRFSGRAVRALARSQKRILRVGARLVGPGGTLAYSTCSLEAEENRGVVDGLLAGLEDFHLAAERTIQPAGAGDPTRWSDGGYLAILRRSPPPAAGDELTGAGAKVPAEVPTDVPRRVEVG